MSNGRKLIKQSALTSAGIDMGTKAFPFQIKKN
jgi:hypothetical protein